MTTHQTTVALRVLRAINQHQNPAKADVDLLRTYLPDHANDAPDELACAVILRRLEVRKKANGSAQDHGPLIGSANPPADTA
jgi:hypothetical protein